MATKPEDTFVEKMNEMLFEWLKKMAIEAAGKSKPKADDKTLIKPKVDAKEICQKATGLCDLLAKNAASGTIRKTFSADRTWYNNFCAEALQKNILLTPTPSITSLSDELTSGKYQREQIWLGAHFGLFYMRMTDGSEFAKDEAKRGKRRSRKHISLLLTANMAYDPHQLKCLIVHSTSDDLRETKEYKQSMIMQLDKAKGRLTKTIMLKWLRENFYEEVRAYYEENNLLVKSEIPPTVLFLSECFKEYFKDETISPFIKLGYFADGKRMDFGTEINTKAFIVRPFVANYLRRLLIFLEMSKNETLLEAWSSYDINSAFGIISMLISENCFAHMAAFLPQFCFNCSPIFNDSLQNSQEEVNNFIVEIVKISDKHNLGITVKEITSLIEDNLNFCIHIEDLASEEAAAVTSTSETPSTSASSAIKRPANSSTAATPKTKRVKLARSLTDQQKGQLKIDLFNTKDAIENLKKAQSALKHFSEKVDVTANEVLAGLLEHCEEKSAKLEKDLRFGSQQSSITSFFQVSKSTNSTQNEDK